MEDEGGFEEETVEELGEEEVRSVIAYSMARSYRGCK